jgi:hypothetical protein
MSTELRSQSNSFIFNDEFNPFNKSYYNVNIIVKELVYNNGAEYYDISYKYEYFEDLDTKNKNENESKNKNAKQMETNKKCHPFWPNLESASGYIIKKNTMTATMVIYLMMNYEELAKYSGNVTAQGYKRSIIAALALFWD